MPTQITRRDFIHDVGIAGLGLALPLPGLGAPLDGSAPYYPPTLTGLRGAHPGSFEVAHALAREGRHFDNPQVLDETYDLVVVGGGISGLAAAYFHRKLHGPQSKILVLDNHDDFGGHAKRNEFHQGGPMRLAWGGTVNIEYPKYSPEALGLLRDLGIDIPRLRKDFDFNWIGSRDTLKPALLFDEARYGRDVMLRGVTLDSLEPEDARRAGRCISAPRRRAREAQGLPAGGPRRARGQIARGTRRLPARHELHGFPAPAVRPAGRGHPDLQQCAVRLLGRAGRASLRRGRPLVRVAGRACRRRLGRAGPARRTTGPWRCSRTATAPLRGCWCAR